MEIVGRLGQGCNLGVHALDGVLMQPADACQVRGLGLVQPTPQPDRVGASVLRFLVVQERIRTRGDDLVRQNRRFGRIATMDSDFARLDTLQQRSNAVDVQRFMQRVVDSLANEHVVRDLDGADDVVLAGSRHWEHRREQIVGLHALYRRRIAPPVAEPRDHEGTVQVPPPPSLEHR